MIDDDLFTDIYCLLYDDLLRSQLENQYQITKKINEDDLENLDTDQFGNSNNTVLFDTGKYFKDILKSYNFDRNKIWEQFLLDFPRTSVIVQNKNIENYQQIFEPVLEKISKIYRIGGRWFLLKDVLSLLCNQSSYAFPYVFLIKLYADDNHMLSSQESNRFISYTLENDSIQIKLSASFAVKNVRDGNTKFTIESEIVLDTNLNKSDIFQSCGIFSWNIVENN